MVKDCKGGYIGKGQSRRIKRHLICVNPELILILFTSLYMEDGKKLLKRDRMIERQIEKEGKGSEVLFSQKRMMCPSCREGIHEVNLPDVKSIVEDTLTWLELVIVDSSVCFLIDCEHQYEDVGMTLDNPHELTAVVVSEFDSQGECTYFEVREVRIKR